jgi:Mor family transcriptional regulator
MPRKPGPPRRINERDQIIFGRWMAGETQRKIASDYAVSVGRVQQIIGRFKARNRYFELVAWRVKRRRD